MESTAPKIIMGLGNPGRTYADTRHNAGFMVARKILDKASCVLSEEKRFDSLFYRIRYRGWTASVAMPQTFMNVSGRAAAKLVAGLDVSPSELLVIYDCLDLPLGQLRVRMAGGSGGQRGMESILTALGTENVPRLRLGIGREPDRDSVAYVLDRWPEHEKELVAVVLDVAADAALMAMRYGLQKAMDTYNGWQPDPPLASSKNREIET